jgi:hypothetical protein
MSRHKISKRGGKRTKFKNARKDARNKIIHTANVYRAHLHLAYKGTGLPFYPLTMKNLHRAVAICRRHKLIVDNTIYTVAGFTPQKERVG